MTLTFGKNLKKLRREKDLTQDELAEKLTLSPQAISRYETGAAYPDIEMLPVMAGFFGVTIDSLLGMSENVRERRMDEYCEKLRTITDRKERLALLRRQHAEFPDAWNVVSNMVHEMTYLPECLDEMRQIVADAVKNCDNILWRENIIFFYLRSEPDEDIACAFIEKWCSRYDMRKAHLLEHHYACRGKQDKQERLRQKMLRDNLVESIRQLTEWAGDDIQASREHCEYALSLLDQLSANPDRQAPDMWADVKKLCLVRLADNLFRLSENEQGFAVLEDAVALAENLFSLPNGTVLSYGTPKLDKLSAAIQKNVYYHITEFSDVIATSLMIDLVYPMPLGPVAELDMEGFAREMFFVGHLQSALQNQNGAWDGFALVKEDARYLALKERANRVSSIENTDNLMFMMHFNTHDRTDDWAKSKQWACALLVKGVGAYVMWDDPDHIDEIFGRMKKEGNTAVYRIAMMAVNGDLMEIPDNIKRRILELNEGNQNAEVLLRGSDGEIYRRVLGN